MRKEVCLIIFLGAIFFFVALTIGNVAGNTITGESITGEATTQAVGMNITVVAYYPGLSIISPENKTYLINESLWLNYSVTNEDSVWYNIDNSANTTITGSTSFNTSQGSHTLYLYANSSLGNVSSDSVVFTVNSSRFTILYSEYNGSTKGSSTNFIIYAYEDLQSLNNIILENNRTGKILFNSAINITNDLDPSDDLLDLDTHTNISKNRIELNSTSLINFNVSSTMWLYNLSFTNPRILINGEVCNASICTKESYDGETLKFNVTGFSTYSAEETPAGGTAPVLGDINTSIFTCEGISLTYHFNVTDLDGDVLDMTINPVSIFFLTPARTTGAVTTNIEIISGKLNKAHAGGTNNGSKVYGRNISTSETYGSYADSTETNITVIEINNAPVIQTIGTQTAYTENQDDDNNITYYYEVNVSDTEDGDRTSVNITFNITFSNQTLFNITNSGVMTFEPDTSQLGLHNLTVCTTDSGIANPHENILIECEQDGSNLSDCETFVLNITDYEEEDDDDQGTAPSGGSGGGGGATCTEKWGCYGWQTCQNAKTSLALGTISGDNYRNIQQECEILGFDDETCGVQERDCEDVNECNTTYNKPELSQVCHYTEKPDCNDGIKNCHNGACELLVDCGGPCPACPTCSDKIQNQGEEGIDCGGPCPWKCEEEKPLLKRPRIQYSLIIIALLLLILIIRFKNIRKYLKGLRLK